MRRHPLRREIIATCVANRLTNRGGMTFAYRSAEASGASLADVARAFTAAREMFDMPSLWAALDDLDLVVPAETQTWMFLEARKLHDRAARWLVRNRRPPLDIAATATFFASGIATLTARLPELMPASDVETLQRTAHRLIEEGTPESIATWVASCEFLDAAPDIVEVAREYERDVEDVARVYFALDDQLELGWLHDEVAGLPRQGRWQTLARAAVRDDLYGTHAALTRDVLRVSRDEPDPAACLAHWADVNAVALRRVTGLIGEIRAAKISDLATLSVAVREVRSILATTA
jgi:glutamate dehydrogenase